jgi:predicted acylesterase/phospholipase RssA
MEDVRYRVGIDTARLQKDGIESVMKEARLLNATDLGSLPPAEFLVISGGGDNGAFGAGLLNGWTVAGGRPDFKLVTGVSTGALTAPFAFLGPAYDDRLKRLYTTISAQDIAKPRNLLAIITSDAAADNAPLWRLIEKEIDQAFLAAVAAEHDKGRILLIATVDLDARQSVLWNMTKIAASRDSKAPDLFRSIMIASAAIPGAFPPVMIDVTAGGEPFQEMHVDGGTMNQLFMYPPSLNVHETEQQLKVSRERRAYIIRNSRLDVDWAHVERKTMDIAGRAVSSLIQTQGVGDLYRVYLSAERDDVDFNLAYIPKDFDFPHREDFDTEYMRALFKRGYDMAEKGYPWAKEPPGL